MNELLLLSLILTGGYRDLGADDFDIREAASARLERAGVLALPVLWEATRSDDPEVCQRADQILDSSRPMRALRRCRLLWQAQRLLHDPGEDITAFGWPDVFQRAEIRDGGPPLWEAIYDLADAEGLSPDDATLGWHWWHVKPPPDSPGEFDRESEVRFINMMRCRARGLPDSR